MATCRDDRFHQEFSRLGEVRSIIPEHVNVMALTATATAPGKRSSYPWTCKNPIVVTLSPMKENIFFCASRMMKVSESFVKNWPIRELDYHILLDI